ncbi:helicase RepA family protein [Corynebacterium sanguinis]|uniref:AAA family ATPase n=1 Tax=Corynebacterium sanguinis TaxID=2594913 RepID=UPI00223C1A76|nr:helicase RepA family protein [Corynebacterium sanguinis]MCT2287834.1 helicase RepA family protein [Corynebacterium sanguinis]
MATNAADTQQVRTVALKAFNEVQDDAPTFAYNLTHSGTTIGTCPIGSIALFAGRPGAGKSTTGRDIAAKVSTGTLPGCWKGTPHGVVYIAEEESARYVVKPALRAAGADMARIYFPEVNLLLPDGGTDNLPLVADRDLTDLAKACIAHDVKTVIVDPLMAFIGSGTDLYKSNEIRERLRPWAQLAESIDGLVIGITHLNKSGNGDVVAGINGSSAFGEVARTVFGFAKDPQADDGSRVMSLEKNSLGEEGLAWRYTIQGREITTDTGKTVDVAALTITGESTETVGEILRHAATNTGEDTNELRDVVVSYITERGGTAPATDIEKEVRSAGLGFKSAQNQKRKWGIKSEKIGGVWVWTLTNSTSHQPPTKTPPPLYTRDLGTLGSSQVTGLNQDPNIPRSQHPIYKETPGPWQPSIAENLILDSLSATHPQTVEQVAKALPRNSRTGTPELLAALVSRGVVAQTPDGTYLLTEER